MSIFIFITIWLAWGLVGSVLCRFYTCASCSHNRREDIVLFCLMPLLGLLWFLIQFIFSVYTWVENG